MIRVSDIIIRVAVITIRVTIMRSGKQIVKVTRIPGNYDVCSERINASSSIHLPSFPRELNQFIPFFGVFTLSDRLGFSGRLQRKNNHDHSVMIAINEIILRSF